MFGAVAREVVDSEKEGDFNKKLIEEVGAEIGLSKTEKTICTAPYDRKH